MRNAEYRLCLERNLDMHDEYHESKTAVDSKSDMQEMSLNVDKLDKCADESKSENSFDNLCDNIDIQGLGDVSPEIKTYILHLQSRLSSVKKVLFCKDLLYVT